MYQIHFCYWQPKEAIMNITKKISVLALSVYCSVFFAADSQSKVCFLGDDNCVNDVNFGNLEKDDSDNLCIKSGYILKEECQTNGNEYIVSYCPYNSSYVACCNKVYAYDSCPPLKYVGKCWNKYKCECDDIYKYTQEQCEQNNAYPAGSSCSHITKNSEQTSIETVIKYSSCRCDRAIYKEDIKNCEDYDSNKVCTDSDSNQYTSSCVCNRDKYLRIAWECEYGGEGEECVEDGITYVEDCCSCSGFPLKQLEGGGYQNCSGGCDKITKVEPCSCDHGKHMVKVVQCAAGWQPTSDRDGCERISCEAAVKLYMSKYPNDGYGLLEVIDGVTSIGYYEPLTDDERNALTGDDLATATYAVSDKWKETSAATGVMSNSKTIESIEDGNGFAGTNAYTVLSGYKFGLAVEDEMVEESCKNTEQTLTIRKSYFNANAYKNVTTDGISLSFDKHYPIVVRKLKIIDAPSITGGTVYFQDEITIENSSNNGTFSGGTFSFSRPLTLSGYDIEVTTSFAVHLGNGPSSITLPQGGSFSGNLYLVDNTKSTNNLKQSNNSSDNAILIVKSSSANTSANLYGNVYVGVCDKCYYDNSAYNGGVSGNVKLELDNVILNLTKKQSSLYMSKGSSVTSKSGGYIKTTASEYKKCSMKASQPIFKDCRFVFKGNEPHVALIYEDHTSTCYKYVCYLAGLDSVNAEYTAGAFSCRIDYAGDMYSLGSDYTAIKEYGMVLTDGATMCRDFLGHLSGTSPKMSIITKGCQLQGYASDKTVSVATVDLMTCGD